MTTLLAIDPACESNVSDTGYCLGEFSEDTPFKIIDSGVIHGGYKGFVKAAEMLDKPDIVVYERFVTYNKVADPSQMLIEGVIRYVRPDAVGQPSSGKNTLVPNTFLKDKGLWDTKGHHHDMVEAIRHAYVWLFKSRHKGTLDELSR